MYHFVTWSNPRTWRSVFNSCRTRRKLSIKTNVKSWNYLCYNVCYSDQCFYKNITKKQYNTINVHMKCSHAIWGVCILVRFFVRISCICISYNSETEIHFLLPCIHVHISYYKKTKTNTVTMYNKLLNFRIQLQLAVFDPVHCTCIFCNCI